ncbi:unnamed protein product [Candida verbasci]|uniref:Uncharacterized protein n=1 Tax=Candida verbasci TaxID=1227364 RepID=A0A9W4TZP1_9ASCO|nr:unnamed protein product [Candida verbasci]
MSKRTLSTSSSFINKLYTSPFKRNTTTITTTTTNEYSPIIPISLSFDNESTTSNIPPPSISSSKKFHFQSPLETKKYTESKCCFCHDLLSLILPGEIVLPLICDHVCHKNCFILMLNKKQLDKLPICGICKLPTKCYDDLVYQNIIENIHLHQEIEIDSNKPLPPLPPLPPPSPPPNLSRPVTPKKQQKHKFITSHLETPPKIEKNDLNVYQPIIEFEEISRNNNEIDYQMTIKPPLIFNQDSNLNLYELQLKVKISNFIKKNLHLQRDLGELICFDNLNISIDGLNFENSIVYLFENYLIFYDLNDLPLGMIHKSDFCNLNLIEDNILCLNLCKESLPELYLQHEFNNLIISKWEYLINSMNESLHTNLYQFTSTMWIKYKEVFQISKDLVKFNQLILQNYEIPNKYLIKILPPPKMLKMNLIISISLINLTELSDLEYKMNLQELIEKVISNLGKFDTLSIIFIGIDNNRKSNSSGIYIGPIEKNWQGWKEIIEDIEILPNCLMDNNHELNLSIEKCIELLPFINKDQCINKFMIFTSSNYEDDDITNFNYNNFNKLNEIISVNFISIDNKINFVPNVISKSSFDHLLSTLLSSSIQEFKEICIPDLKININTNKGVKSSSNIYNIKNLSITNEKKLNVKFNIDDIFDSNLPLFEYNCSWFNDTKFINSTKIMTRRQPCSFKLPQIPLTPNNNDYDDDDDEIDIDISIK